MTHRRVEIAAPSVGEEEWLALREPLESGWLTQGPKVAEFEQAFAERHAVPHALATTSCTTALHLGLAAAGIGPGDEVIVPSFTWVATANAVLYCGAVPVLADVDPETFNIDPKSVAEHVTDRTRAVIPVHLFGLCVDVQALADAIPESVLIVEDAACAAGASCRDSAAGGLGAVGAFSFHPRKAVTTGEGGMMTTTDPEVAARAERLRNHGAGVSEEVRHRGAKPWELPEFADLGFNYRMTDLQAAIGIVQLGKLDGFISERQRGADLYAHEFADLEWLRTPSAPDGWRHAWQSYVCMVDEDALGTTRDAIMERLADQGVSTRPGTHAVHMLQYYRERYGFDPNDFPRAAECAQRSMAIPLHNRMTDDDFEHVVSALRGL